MEHVTFDDIPYHIIVECIAIHLGMKEFGSLSMMSVYLREIFMSNDVWKRLYINTLKDKFKITDKSVHVGSSIYAHKSRIPTEELPWYSRNRPYWFNSNISWYNFTGPFQDTMYICGCVPPNSVSAIASATCQYIRTDPVSNTITDDLESDNLAKKYLKSVVLKHNKLQGHNHSRLCTNLDHYLFDTLDAPKSVRNYKDFRKQVLSKFLTNSKNNSDIKQANTRIAKKKKKIEQYKEYMRHLEKEIEKDNVIIEKNETLCYSLKKAIKK